MGSSPPSRPGSAVGFDSPGTPLHVRKTRRSFGAATDEAGGYYPAGRRPALRPKTPGAGIATVAAAPGQERTPPSENSTRSRSRSSSRLSWGEEDSPMLGLAGPTSRPVEMSEESRAWVESVKEKVRLASGEFKVPSSSAGSSAAAAAAGVGPEGRGLFGEMGRVGGTKRLFRKKGHRESQGHSVLGSEMGLWCLSGGGVGCLGEA